MAWRDDVWMAVCGVPRGRVVSYGDVAGFLGHPLRARQVGMALGALDEAAARRIPWQRVVNARGYLSIRGAFAAKDVQRALLRSEGVVVGDDYVVEDFAAARWLFPGPSEVNSGHHAGADELG
jgi:methylated-DNA-protein-cysteine methyltransferase-like protein